MCQGITGRKLTFPGNIQAESIAGIVLICREGLVFALLQQVKIIPVKHYQGTRIVSSLPVPGSKYGVASKMAANRPVFRIERVFILIGFSGYYYEIFYFSGTKSSGSMVETLCPPI